MTEPWRILARWFGEHPARRRARLAAPHTR